MKDRILIVAAHPDDEVLGCGGTIAKFTSEGAEVRVVFLAEGVTSRYDESEIDSSHVQEKINNRNNNAYHALEVLSVPTNNIFVEQRHCCRLDKIPLLDIVKQIEYHIDTLEPTRIFTHAPYDTNIDHRLAYKAILAATRPVKKTKLKKIYSFEVLSSTEWNPLQPFIANVFIDIGEYIDLKIKALTKYDDEMHSAPHPRSEEVIKSLARYRGAQAGVNFAEGFSLIRSIE